MTAGSDRAAELRSALTDELLSDGLIVSQAVEAAFRSVPRHLFAPGATLEAAYAKDVVVAKRDANGITVSSVSSPDIQALMLEQADLRPGMHCLEIGSGGYNAALMAHIVGESGQVTTVDIDPEVIERARQCLARAGYSRVNVMLADAEEGAPGYAPYDRIIVTVGAWDIPPAWMGQLADGGRIVVPLRMRGLTRSVMLERQEDHLLSRSAKVCGFVKMQGIGQHDERVLLLRGREIALRFDDGWPSEPGLLDGALNTERREAWSGVIIGRFEPFDTLQLWLASALDGFCLVAVDRGLDTGLVAPVPRMGGPAVVDGATFAYLAVRPAGEDIVEFGAHAFGPGAATLAASFAQQVRIWDEQHRGGPGPYITIYPSRAPDDQLPAGRVIDKRHVRVIVSWPAPDNSGSGQAVPAPPIPDSE